jgi:hypothetical protein
MPTTSANLGLTLPTPNVDTGWGGTLNTDFTLIDNLFTANGSGTSVGLQVGTGKTLNVGGTMIAGGTVILGSGDGTASTTAPTMRGAARTGTNAVGPNLTIDALNGTGTGGSGRIIFRTAPAGSTGSVANTMRSSLEMNAAGAIAVNGANYGTANQVLVSGGSSAATNWGNVDGSVLSFAGQAQGDVIYRGASTWDRLAAGTAGQVLKTGGAAANPSWSDPVTMGTAQTTTAVSSVTFTSIPAGVKRISFIMSNVSNSGGADIRMQIGDSGGIETTGYAGSCSFGGGSATTFYTGSFILNNNNVATAFHSGIATLVNISGNTWVISGTLCGSSGGAPCYFGGSKTLSDVLDRVQISTVTGTFDNGSINIAYD